jgi:hypothetical protein
MIIRAICPQCQSLKYKKNGHIHHGKQNYQCKDDGRQFVDCFAPDLVSDDTRVLIERLLVERISLRGIWRAIGITLTWPLGFLVECFEALPDHFHVQPVTCKHNGVIPAMQHRAISKLARQTHHVERFNNTRRQRVSRLVRETLSFSKKLANHSGAMKMFICHDNLTRAAA